MRFGKRAAEHGEVLREDEHHPAVHGPPPGDHAVTGNGLRRHIEIDAAVLDEHVVFLETAFVEQELDSFPRRQFPLCVLGIDSFLAAAQAGRVALPLQLTQNVLHNPVYSPIPLVCP